MISGSRVTFGRLLVAVATSCLLGKSTAFVLDPTAATATWRAARVCPRQPRRGAELSIAKSPDELNREFQEAEAMFEELSSSPINKRRLLLRNMAVVGATLSVQGIALPNASAAMKSSQTVFEVGKDLTVDEAKARFKEGQESIEYLLQNYEDIREGGGDNVRRYLGTVGTTSGLYGISKVMKILAATAEDLVEYNEAMEEVNAALVGADGSAYMAIFTETSTSGVPPAKYFDDAKIEIKRAKASMQELANQAGIR